MNRKSLALILTLPIFLISCSSYQTTGRSRMIAPGSSFCFICCACIGSGVLEILDSARFKISYTQDDKKEERIIEGSGNYFKQGSLLKLQFVDVPVVKPEIRLKKIDNSDRIEIRVTKVIDPLMADSAGTASVDIIANNYKNPVLQQFVFPARNTDNTLSRGNDSDNTLIVKATVKSTSWKLEASFMGKNKITIPFEGPGIYEAEIVMPSDYADVHLGSDVEMTFEISYDFGEPMITLIGNSEIYFTTRSCSCN